MDEAVKEKKEFQLQRGNLLLMPYDARVGNIKEEVLVGLYHRLHDENLWPIVFHEDGGCTLLSFMNFFSSGKALLQIMAMVNNDGSIVDIVGMAWLGDIVVCGGILTKGTGSFVFFQDFQRPAYTDQFGEILIEYWFEVLGLDVIFGVTPEPNRTALIYVKRAGFKEVARIPNYTTFKGEVVTGVVTSLTKKEYENSAGG